VIGLAKIRSGRVSEQIKKELSQIILVEMKDPRINFLTITGTEITNDLSSAKIFISVMGTEEQQQQTLKTLASSKGYIRSELGKRIRLRIVPELSFILDESIAYGSRIGQLLNDIHRDGK
jgi:ribosome-binding factor A